MVCFFMLHKTATKTLLIPDAVLYIIAFDIIVQNVAAITPYKFFPQSFTVNAATETEQLLQKVDWIVTDLSSTFMTIAFG